MSTTAVVAQQSEAPSEFRPYSTVYLAYDTNFFRVEDFTQKPTMSDDSELSEAYAGIGAGFEGYLDLGLNRLTYAAELARQVHAEFSEVSYTGGNADVQFEWGAGAPLSGAFGYEFRRDRIDFENQDRPLNDYRNTHELEASVSQRVSTRWRVNASGGVSDSGFDERSERDPTRTYGGLGLTYRSRQNNTVDFSATLTERSNSGIVNLDYREISVGPDVRWALSPKLRLRAVVKHTTRDADDPQLSDYEGAEGRLLIRWEASPKVELSSELRHDVTSLGDLLSNYAIVDSLRLTAHWEASEKLSFELAALRENRDFREEPTASRPGVDVRDDDLTYLTLRTDWTPRRKLVYWLQIGAGERSSNRAGQDFDYQRYAAGLRWYF